MRNKTIWAIRDARGLTTSEKTFLFVVESRGTAKTYRKTLMNDTGASDGQITNLVRSLKEKGCVITGESDGRTTYRVSHDAVSRLVPDRDGTHSVSNSAQSASHGTHSVSVEGSLSEDNKKNNKKNTKEKMKKNNTAPVADAPVTVSPQGGDGETDSQASMGTVWVSETGDVLFEAIAGSGIYLLRESGVSALALPNTRTAPPNGFEERSAANWREIRAARPLTKDEKSFLEARSRAFQEERRAAEHADSQVEAW